MALLGEEISVFLTMLLQKPLKLVTGVMLGNRGNQKACKLFANCVCYWLDFVHI